MDLLSLLEYLEEHIDPDHCRNVENRHISAMEFQDPGRMPLTIDYPMDSRIKQVPYREAFSDFAEMLYHQLGVIGLNVLNSVEIKDDYPLQIRPNYGIGLIPSLFGANIRLVGDNMPWIDHILDREAVLRMIDEGIPELDSAIGKKVRQCCEYYRETFEHYPKCREFIKITHPDMQSPFDNLHLILGNDLFYYLYDEPDLLHGLLNLITDTYIAYCRFIEPYTTGTIGSKNYVHFAIYNSPVVLKDDTATTNISAEMYQEFALPYNKKIASVFGGCSLHYCGPKKSWHYQNIAAIPVSCLNFGNPEGHPVIEDYDFFVSKKICVVGFGQGQNFSFIKKLINGGIKTGFTCMIKVDSRDNAVKILDEYRS
jgi:hypothetical protein